MNHRHFILLVFVVVVICLFADLTSGGSGLEKQLGLTLEEKSALNKFKKRLIPRLPHAYMKTELYLIRWLRARDLNQQEAERMLLDNLQWRKSFGMDRIGEDEDYDWTDLIHDYGLNYTTNTVDNQGRPIGMASIGSWDIRRAAQEGKIQRIARLGYKFMEELTRAVFHQQALGNKGVTQWSILFNMKDFDTIQGDCPHCIATYLTLFRVLEDRYPGWANQIIFVNTSQLFETLVLEVAIPLLSPGTSNTSLWIFGVDRSEWGPYLDKEITRDQRWKSFGGSLEH